MRDIQMYKDYGHSIRNRLIEDVNGYVKFDLIPEADCIIFHITFKDFRFRYVITDVSQSIYHGTSEEVVQGIEQKYRRSIMSAFFRTEENKERLERRRLGIPDSKEDIA
jgi:hypothetical protein